MERINKIRIFCVSTLILTLIECAHGTTEVAEQKREFGLDLVSNILGIVASSLTLLGHGHKITGEIINRAKKSTKNKFNYFKGKLLMFIVIPIAFVAGILVSVIVVIGFIFILNTIVINLMFLMNIALILGKLLYGRSGTQVVNYPNQFPQFPPQYPSPFAHEFLSPLSLKVLKSKKLFLLAKLFKLALIKHPDIFKNLGSETNQIKRISEDSSLETFIENLNESNTFSHYDYDFEISKICKNIR